MNNKAFRADINGLRAIAVIAVVIFHYNSAWLQGGFAGVDVFFVISGYLMTKIIYSGLSHGNFSIYTFLKNRFTRIVPALTIVVISILLLGYIFFEPLSYKIVGKHAVSSLLFYSNLTYQNEIGYFDIESLSKILLHSWSLSIEWQFYMLYPILLIFLFKKTKKNNTKKIILASTILLFIINLFLSFLSPEKSYFMLTARAWEMLVGGLAFFYPLNKLAKNRFFEITGILIILFGYFFLSSAVAWPSYYALIPVFGAYLIIFQAKEKSILDSKPLQLLGTTSYSVYLVHWPILAFSNKLNFNISFPAYLILIIVLTFILHVFVERKRNYSWKFLMLFIITLALSSYVSKNGVSDRLDNREYSLSLQKFRDEYEGHVGVDDEKGKVFFNSNDDEFDYILIGDSHARHLYSYIESSGLKVVSFALDGCLSTENFYSQYNSEVCAPRYEQIIDFISEHPNKTIIWSSLWGRTGNLEKRNGDIPFSLEHEMNLFVKRINTDQLFLIGSTPRSNYITYECLAKKELPINRLLNNVDCPKTEKNEENLADNVLISIAKSYPNVHYIKASDALCNSTECKVIDDNVPIFTDTHHLTKHGSSIVGQYIFSHINTNK
ncbi:acyltransferase family protein [Providencia rettgeri]